MDKSLESSQTPDSFKASQSEQKNMGQQIDKVIKMLKDIKQMHKGVIFQAPGKKKFSCDERFPFRWNRDMTLAIDCNWRYNFPGIISEVMASVWI